MSVASINFIPMNRLLSLLLATLSPVIILAQKTIPLQKGLTIQHSVAITGGQYLLDADTSLTSPVIVIDGKNITVDFNNCVLQGMGDINEPNKFHGLAIYIKKGSANVTIKNAKVHGFKVALMADSVPNIRIENCNFSYNYRQHLHSNFEREDISDWMSYHHNENDEWLRYGAGIYLKNCNNAVIRNNIITNGQCGLMMTGCAFSEVFDNNFSFNSGIGIGLYRSSNNRIYHNILNYNVRGFSFGKYYRGQDSAGILVFEQCNNNLIAFNAVTHSGDGFFLWAGQYTMDTGKGGCNDNLIYSNDFSYAPTNGVEVTFSRNNIEENTIVGCDNGVWGGYSYNSRIVGNQFAENNTAIAIEHGQHNLIAGNDFNENKIAVKLWSRSSQPPDWGYARERDTRSMHYVIKRNSFLGNGTVFDIMGTDSLYLAENTGKHNRLFYHIGERTYHIDSSIHTTTDTVQSDGKDKIKSLPVHALPITTLPSGGRREIRMTEWGPYNFEYPILWLANIDSNGIYHFEILGKSGKWSIARSEGIKQINYGKNEFPSSLTVKLDSNLEQHLIQLRYTGQAFTDAYGAYHREGTPYYFQFQFFTPLNRWDVSFYSWDTAHNPAGDFGTFTEVFKRTPLYSITTPKIDYTWWGKITMDLPADSFATMASTVFDLPENDYRIGITADDLAKVFIDGSPVIDAWDPHYVDVDENTYHEKTLHLKGKHSFKIVHAEINGLATLMFYIQPVSH